jgi:hypothetical protein
MDAQREVTIRTVVVARPKLARHVEAILSSEGHEVYRTPDAAGVASLIVRVRPHLVIIALDIPWADSTETPLFWDDGRRSVPVLLIGDIEDDHRLTGFPRLPSEFIADYLIATVAELLTVSDPDHEP